MKKIILALAVVFLIPAAFAQNNKKIDFNQMQITQDSLKQVNEQLSGEIDRLQRQVRDLLIQDTESLYKDVVVDIEFQWVQGWNPREYKNSYCKGTIIKGGFVLTAEQCFLPSVLGDKKWESPILDNVFVTSQKYYNFKYYADLDNVGFIRDNYSYGARRGIALIPITPSIKKRFTESIYIQAVASLPQGEKVKVNFAGKTQTLDKNCMLKGEPKQDRYCLSTSRQHMMGEPVFYNNSVIGINTYGTGIKWHDFGITDIGAPRILLFAKEGFSSWMTFENSRRKSEKYDARIFLNDLP